MKESAFYILFDDLIKQRQGQIQFTNQVPITAFIFFQNKSKHIILFDGFYSIYGKFDMQAIYNFEDHYQKVRLFFLHQRLIEVTSYKLVIKENFTDLNSLSYLCELEIYNFRVGKKIATNQVLAKPHFLFSELNILSAISYSYFVSSSSFSHSINLNLKTPDGNGNMKGQNNLISPIYSPQTLYDLEIMQRKIYTERGEYFPRSDFEMYESLLPDLFLSNVTNLKNSSLTFLKYLNMSLHGHDSLKQIKEAKNQTKNLDTGDSKNKSKNSLGSLIASKDNIDEDKNEISMNRINSLNVNENTYLETKKGIKSSIKKIIESKKIPRYFEDYFTLDIIVKRFRHKKTKNQEEIVKEEINSQKNNNILFEIEELKSFSRWRKDRPKKNTENNMIYQKIETNQNEDNKLKFLI